MIEYIVRVYDDGSKTWWFDDKCHREDGPAIEYSDGSKEWYLYGKCHRVDGPAYEGANGTKSWWIDGKHLSEEEFHQRTNSCNGKIIEVDGKKYKLVEI